MLLSHAHRDLLGRVFRYNDYVVWSNGKYNSIMQVCRVTNTTNLMVTLLKPDGTTTRAYPSNLIIITQQVYDNLNSNVGAVDNRNTGA